jgi:hypothetical protein
MQMNRIVMHHTAGALTPSAFDKQHYHRLIDGEGRVHQGAHHIAANAPGRALTSGTYAAHTRGLNTGSIGVSMAAMANAEWSRPRSCPSFPRSEQVEGMVQEVAKLCIEYRIDPGPRTVLSHAEVEVTLGVAQRGKWDFDYDPAGVLASRDPLEIGDSLRDRVLRAIETMGFDVPSEPIGTRPVLRRGARSEVVREMQQLLIKNGARIDADRAFGPMTYAAVVAFQKSRQLYPDGVVGKMTWAALLAG